MIRIIYLSSNYLKSTSLTPVMKELRGFEWFLNFFILFNPFITGKIEKIDF